MESIPEKIQEIYLYQQINFSYSDNNQFFYNYNDVSIKEIIVAIHNEYYAGNIMINGPNFSMRKYLGNTYYSEIYLNLNKTGSIFFVLDKGSEKRGEFYFFPIKREINIINFK